jgi:hypothetical protein
LAFFDEFPLGEILRVEGPLWRLPQISTYIDAIATGSLSKNARGVQVDRDSEIGGLGVVVPLIDSLATGQAAALLVVRDGWGYGGANDRYIDLRVDDHPQPITELRRIQKIHHQLFGRK